jgi:pimeloyl-ACP methyl ester carboxylesterase
MMGNAELIPRFIRANGLDFAYLSQGEGPLVLCLHGFPDTAWSFRDLLSRLAGAGYHAVAPFMRGYPPTELPQDGDYSLLALGRDIIALIEDFGVPQAYLVGHDWGAAATYAAAALRPDRVRRCVAAALPHLRRFVLRPTLKQLRASSYIFKFQMPRLPEHYLVKDDFAWLKELGDIASPGWHPPADMLAAVRAAFADPARLRAALGYYRALPRSLLKPEVITQVLKPLQVPARLIYGEKDGVVLPEMFEGQEHLFAAGYDLVPLPNVGHFMHLEAPDVFATKVIEFLRAG